MTNPVIEKKVKAPRKAAPKVKDAPTPEPQIQLRLELATDAEKGSVSVNDTVVTLGRTDFQLLYALAHLQVKNGQARKLVRVEQLMQSVRELFPRFETPASVRSTGQAAHEQAFEAKLEQVLSNLEIDPGSPSGRRWRHLLLSQARRYAGGQDTNERYELISELKQHKDLLGMMVQRFEQMGQLPPLGTPAARLHRFFVPETAAAESERRFATYIAEHLDQVRQILSKTLSGIDEGLSDPFIIGKAGQSDWLLATAEGFRFSSAIALELVEAEKV